jgi:hypothetical protein
MTGAETVVVTAADRDVMARGGVATARVAVAMAREAAVRERVVVARVRAAAVRAREVVATVRATVARAREMAASAAQGSACAPHKESSRLLCLGNRSNARTPSALHPSPPHLLDIPVRRCKSRCKFRQRT